MTSNYSKQQFLDPVSTFCKLSLLNFSSLGTKIRIVNHKIELTENSVLENYLYRTIYRDSRFDICVLFPVIVRFIEHYIIISETNPTNEHTKKLAKYAIMGLVRLGKTYNYDNTVFALQYYVNLLQSAIDDEYDNKLLPLHLQDITKSSLINMTDVKKLWTDSEIEFMCNAFTSWISSDVDKNIQTALSISHEASIYSMLRTKEDRFVDWVTKTNST